MRVRKNQRGYVLLPVLSLIALLAIFVYMANRSLSVDGKIYQTDKDKDQAFYVARAGLQHTLWGIREQNTCFGYQNLSNTLFDGGGYNATIDTTFGSPVVISAKGTLTNGVSEAINSTAAITKTVTIELQPDDINGKDTYISANAKDVSKNFGADKTIVINNDKDFNHALIQFDLSTLPAGTEIISASLSLYAENTGAGTPTEVEVHRVTQSWNEGDQNNKPSITGATWNTYDAVNPWLAAGGDYNPIPVANQLIDGNLKNVWLQWDVTSLARDWLNGTVANDGMLLKPVGAGLLKQASFSSSDSGKCLQFPKLSITVRCDCAMKSFSTNALGFFQLLGMTYIPENKNFRGIVIPAGGAWLFVSSPLFLPSFLHLTDLVGVSLANMFALPPRNGLRDVTIITSGTWTGRLAYTDSANAAVHIVNMQTGAIEATIPTNTGGDSFTTAPMGITCIENALDCTYDGYLAVSSDLDKNGLNQGTIGIIDQTGKRKTTIDVDAVAPNPRGILHLPGTDNLLIVDRSGQATVIDFTGNIINSYATATFGVSSQVQGLALSTIACHPVVNDAAQEMVIEIP